MEEVIIEVNRQADIKITTKGFKGKACMEATASLKKALGGEVLEETPTKEMSETDERTDTRGRVRG